jgi:thiamine biosynthesis lipoprotein
METRKPATRRQFITGEAAVTAVQDAAARAAARNTQQPSLFDAAAAGEAPYLVRYGREAMATDFQLFFVAGEGDAEAAVAALDVVDEVETQLTVYRDTSEILEINRRAAYGPVAVEPRLFALLELAARLYRETAGAYDITSGPLSRAWGFARRAGAVPDPATLEAARELVGGEKLLLDPAAQTVRFARPGVEINANSIGKGYALDRGAEILAERGPSNFLWHGGRSSVLARGTSRPGIDVAAPATPGSPSATTDAVPARYSVGWPIGIGHPLRLERRLAELLLFDEAAGTSGAGFQFFRHEGKRYGHILDPRTGRPAEGVFSVTVVAPTAAEADALSTAFYVMGFDAAVEYCAGHPEIGFLMLLPTPGGAIELATCNLDSRRWRLAP